MRIIREVRTVARPVQEVFDWVADFSTTQDWDPGVARAVALDPIGLGTRFQVDALFFGRRVPMSYRILRYDRPKRLELVGTGASCHARDVILFRQSTLGTTIDWRLELSLTGPARWVEPFLASALEQAGRRALDGLERAMEVPESEVAGARSYAKAG